jgi:hypothetical protein
MHEASFPVIGSKRQAQAAGYRIKSGESTGFFFSIPFSWSNSRLLAGIGKVAGKSDRPKRFLSGSGEL